MDILIYLAVFGPMAAAFLSYLIGRSNKHLRDWFLRAAVIAEFLLCLLLAARFGNAEAEETVKLGGVCGFGLTFAVGGFRCIYAAIASFMWTVTALLSPEYFAHYRNRNRYYLFLLITLGATVAIFFSGDLYTTFIFFEIMSLCSYVWVAQDSPRGVCGTGSLPSSQAVGGN